MVEQQNKVAKLIKDYYYVIERLYGEGYIIEHNNFRQKCIATEKYILTWSGRNAEANITFDLSLEINELLNTLLDNKQFCMLFYDKSILQVEYTIENNNVVKQRLQYIKKSSNIIPKSEFEKIEREIDEVEGSTWFEIEKGIPIFMRVDYDPVNHIDLFHSKSHFAISNIKDCRIPMRSNITLAQFVTLILHQVYNDYSIEINNSSEHQDEITENEQKYMYFNWL